MIRALSSVIALALVMPTHEQSTPISPCPNVFMYESSGTEPGRWYGVVHLSTDSTLHSVWLNIVLDSKADILGNWVGDVTTQDNIDFKIENTQMKITPGPAVAVRFFAQYNPLNPAPKLLQIRLNGKEICNANTPRPTNYSPNTDTSRPSRPDRPTTKPVSGRPSSSSVNGPVYVKPVNSPNPSTIPSDENPSQNVNYGLTTANPNRRTTSSHHRTNPPDYDDDDVSKGDPGAVDYWPGGQITIKFPSSGTSTNNQQDQCGKVVLNANPLVVNGTPTLEGQWPWQIALYHTQTVDHKYICGGTLVTHRHIITAAHCVTLKNSKRPVNKNTLTVYLGKHNLRTSVTGVQIKFVSKITIHPEYNETTFDHDVAVLKTRDAVEFTDWVRPACLWPENQVDLSNIVGKKGSVVGWGYDETGMATEELTLVEMPIVSQETCIRSYNEFFARFTSDYTYCAGYRDGTSVCNGDSGGGMVFRIGQTWHLRGIVSVSVARENEYRCDPSHYVIFADVATILSWIRQVIN